mgnify:CR=1 FL=1
MDHKLAIIDLRAGGAGADTAMKPLMLQPMLFCPVVRWVCQELLACGIERFFVVCEENWRNEAAEALHDISGVSFYDRLEEAFSAAEGGVIVVPGPVVPTAGEESRAVYAADTAVLRTRLAESLSLTDCPAEAVGIRTLWQAETLPPAFLPVVGNFYSGMLVSVPLHRAQLLSGEPAVARIEHGGNRLGALAPGVTLLPGTILRGGTVIGTGCEIGPNSMIRDCVVGEYTTVNASQLNESTIGSPTTVGPFAYVRPDCTVGDHCRIGDFVELKNSKLDDGTKVSHLTYVGDSDIGKRVNFGCGTVTTNYNGLKKYRCTVGDDVFLGCNTNLIAPVTIGDGAYTAAGSTVDKDVPAGALAIARARQENKLGWAARFFKSKKK